MSFSNTINIRDTKKTPDNGKQRLPESANDIFKILEDYVSSEDSDFSNDSSDYMTDSDGKEEYDSQSEESGIT